MDKKLQELKDLIDVVEKKKDEIRDKVEEEIEEKVSFFKKNQVWFYVAGGVVILVGIGIGLIF